MHEAIEQMLAKYRCITRNDYHNALKEIVQELALFGLWRQKFFEHTAFYGGTALRIMHGLNRFSEDLDFSLLKPDATFSLAHYEKGIRNELEGFGFTFDIEIKKKKQSAIQSAFLKANTIEHLLKIGMPAVLGKPFHPNEKIKIKFEVDIDPPPIFQTETLPLFLPVPFSVRTYQLPDLFAGKICAALFRQWNKRVKGRDWYDFLWFVGKNINLHLAHLEARMRQIHQWELKKTLTLNEVKSLLHKKIDQLDLKLVKDDVIPFIKDPVYIEGWSQSLFHGAVDRMQGS